MPTGKNPPLIFQICVDNQGAPVPGGALYHFVTNTAVPKDIFYDFELTSPCPQPLVADSEGRYPQYFLEDGQYTFVEHDAPLPDGNQLRPPAHHIEGGGGGTEYTLPVATDDTLGGVKGGGDVEIDTDGTMHIAYDNIPGPDLSLLPSGDLILKQGTGVGSLLLEVETDFSWSGWAGGTTLGGRGIAAGFAWFGEPGSQVHLPVWGANDAYATLYWTRDFWATTVEDSSLSGIIGPGTLEVQPPCMAYVQIGGVWCWVLTSNATGEWWYAQDIAANYSANGSIKSAAWTAGTPAIRVMADIATSTLEGVSCMVGNHSRIIRTTDWATWTDQHNTGGPVIGGIATDNAGTWIAVERDTGKLIRSVDGGLTWTNPTIYKRTGESGAYVSATTLIPAGAVVQGNGAWLVTGATSYAYSPDGLYWTVENAALGTFYGVGFDGVRYFATNPQNGTDPAIIYQLLVSSIPFHRQVVAERGLVVGGDTYLKDFPDATGFGTDQNGKIYDLELGNRADAAKGAGRIGLYGTDLRTLLDRWSVNLLRYIPSTEWAGIRSGSTTYDCTPALEDAIAAAPAGAGIYAPAGHYKFYTSCRIKKGIHIRGDGGLALFGGTTFYKAADVLTFDVCADGIYTTSENWINAPMWEQIRFQTLQPAGQPKWTSDFIMERLCLGGGYIKCLFNAEGPGACVALERVQDKVLDAVFFRGGGEELGGKAQLYLMAPRITINPAIPFDDSVNEIRGSNCHFEWGPGVGTYTDPETGATRTTANNIAIKSLHRDGSLSNNNGIKIVNSKIESVASSLYVGQNHQFAAVQLDRAVNFQFHGSFNQAKQAFYGVGCRNIRIWGAAPRYFTPDPAGYFARFERSDVLNIDIGGYDVSPNQFIECSRINERMVNASEFSPYGLYAVDDIGGQGAQRNANLGGRANGRSMVTDIATPTKDAVRSAEISFADNYGDVIVGARAPYLSRFRNGMTVRFKASATMAGHKVFVGYHSQPSATRTQCDGATVDFPIGMFFPVDPDFPSLIPVTVVRQNRDTGASTTLVEGVDYTLSGESNFQGGTVTLASAPSSLYDITISRAQIKKDVIDFTVSTTPEWFSAYIPPGVLRLENVHLVITAAPTSEVAGLYYTVHEVEFVEGAQSSIKPYFPARVSGGGPGQPPNASGGYDCGWEVGAFVAALRTNNNAPVLLGWECTSTTGNNGVGSFVEVYADRETSIVNTGTTSYTLPDPATQAIGAKRRYTNNGTATITITAFAGDTFAKCSQTVLSLGVGESVLLEYTAANVWSIVDGLVSMAEIVFSGDIGQSIATATTAKVTAFNVNGSESVNCTPDQANKQIVVTCEAMYQIEARLSWYTNVITNYVLSIFVDNVLAGISAPEFFGATGSATSQVETVNFSVRKRIPAGKVIDLRIAHSDAGSVTAGIVRASLSARRLP